MRNGRKIGLIFILLFSIVIPLSTTFAASEEYTYESNWAITVDFIKTQPVATLQVEVWKYQKDSLTLLDYMSSSYKLTCQVPSSVTIKNSTATFTGGEGIECALPSVKNIVSNMTNGDYQPPDTCSCKTGAIVQSKMTLTPNKSNVYWQNPIASMESIAFNAFIPADSGLRTRLQMTVDGQTAVSTLFAGQSYYQLYEGSFDELNPYLVPLYTYFNLFATDSDILAASPSIMNGPLFISNVEKVLHIGYDPKTGSGLHGRMKSLFVDPGCFGNGGY